MPRPTYACEEDFEYAIDSSLASSDADHRMLHRGIPLADFEDEPRRTDERDD